MSYYYWLAHNDLSDAFWACHYGNTAHPLYGMCNICPSFGRCTSDLKQANQLKAIIEDAVEDEPLTEVEKVLAESEKLLAQVERQSKRIDKLLSKG